MRSLTIALILILASVLSGCRTSMLTAKKTSEIADAEVEAAKEKATNEEILSILAESADVELSGIVVEYYAPDPITPDARASPKSVHIERASAKTTTQASEHKEAATADKDTITVRNHSQRAEASDTKVEAKASNPFPFLIIVILVGALIFYWLKK